MIYAVGLGPGKKALRSFAADQAMRQADVLVGYTVYVDLVRDEFPDKPVFVTGMRGEKMRCEEALRLSRAGKTVAVLCSGDPSVYGMASLLCELANADDEIVVVPGLTAALCASALLGAPLSGDFVTLSLSDLLTPWDVIEKRLEAAAMGDFPIALYNPCSHKRADYLRRAKEILLRRQPGDIWCGWAKNLGREGECFGTTTLARLHEIPADMFTVVIVGASVTRMENGRLVTPRGYRL